MAREIDISFLGDKKLSRKLKRIPVQTRNTIIRKAFRSSNKRVRGAVGRALSGEIVSPDTGRWLNTMKTANRTGPTVATMDLPMCHRAVTSTSTDWFFRTAGYSPHSGK